MQTLHTPHRATSEVLVCCGISNRFCLQWKVFIFQFSQQVEVCLMSDDAAGGL